uniref:Uncharacterized protein n=1 Tax=Caenorhabditis japonica TaxID=281687 RepID=A0A8R1EDZ8_CAEJA
NGVATLRVKMTIDSDFFDLGQYIDLNIRQAHVTPNSNAILGKILAGEEVPKCDWVISVGEGTRRDFHVHGVVLANASLSLKVRNFYGVL